MNKCASIKNTGERILLEEETPLMIARHLRAYVFAKEYCIHKTVLDFGSGQGYGAHYLSNAARAVTGVDYDATAVAFASQNYKKSNLKYICADARNGAFTHETFEVITNFQVIEHITDTRLFLDTITGMLGPDGIFICSTCNKQDASPGSATPLNKFHVREYSRDEFTLLLKGHFDHVQMYGVRRGIRLAAFRRLKKIGVFNILPDAHNPVKKFYSRITWEDFPVSGSRVSNALDFIAVCKKGST